jgi:hypothetical protein
MNSEMSLPDQVLRIDRVLFRGRTEPPARSSEKFFFAYIFPAGWSLPDSSLGSSNLSIGVVGERLGKFSDTTGSHIDYKPAPLPFVG